MTKLKRCPYIQCYTNISYSIMSLPLGFLLHTVSSRSFVDVEFARLEDSRKRVPSSWQSSSERLWMYLAERAERAVLQALEIQYPMAKIMHLPEPDRAFLSCRSLQS